MKIIKRIIVLLLLALLGMNVYAAGSSEKETIRIGVSMSTLANPYFVTMKDSGVATAAKLGVELIVLDAQDDVTKQIANIQDLISRKVNGLIINPVDSDAIVSVVKEANKAKIPVITVTRPSKGGEVVQHIDSDNKFGGKLAGEELAKRLNGRGKVIELEGIPGAPSTRDRGAGFKEELAKSPNIAIVASQTANYNRQQGLEVTENLLQAHPDVNAIFAHNDEMALGAVQALKATNKPNVLVFGFDATDDALKAIERGEMAATVAQQPALQMQYAVENIVKYLKKETIGDSVILLPLKLITKK